VELRERYAQLTSTSALRIGQFFDLKYLEHGGLKSSNSVFGVVLGLSINSSDYRLISQIPMMSPKSPSSSYSTPPPNQTYAQISFPTPQILLVIFNRPRSLNCIDTPSHWELDSLFEWFDNVPSLRVAVVTGMGRAFCAGADLKEWNTQASGPERGRRNVPASGFGALSRRSGKKPVIAAVNGLAYGGGMEMCVNLDMVIAAKSATFALPEVKRGVAAIAGALPRIVRTIGRQRAMEMALTGRTVGAAEAHSWGFVNAVTDDAPVDSNILDRPVVKKALQYAEVVAGNSPDAVIVSREGIKLGWEGIGAEDGARLLMEVWGKRLSDGENMREGLRAFVEKRTPNWVGSKL
jgi:enoyl-CoA hydratase/carnithine racemase